jgi:hypothetical protein
VQVVRTDDHAFKARKPPGALGRFPTRTLPQLFTHHHVPS